MKQTMPAPSTRDLDLPNWYEVPQNATIPAGTRFARTSPGGEWFVVHGPTDYHAADRIPGARYFTAEPIPEPREAEKEG